MKLEAKRRLLTAEEYKSFTWHSNFPHDAKVGSMVTLSGGYGPGNKPRVAHGRIVEIKNGKAKIGITDPGNLAGYRGEVIVDLDRS